MKHTLSLLTGLLLLVAGLVNSQATTLIFTGTFSATPDSNVSSLSGTFQFSFDDSVVTGIGTEFFSPLSLTSFSLIPNPLGATAFNLTNAGAALTYNSGVLAILHVGGFGGGLFGPNSIAAATDDFAVNYTDFTGGGPPVAVLASVASSPSTVGVDSSPSGSLSVIPEPSRALLCLLGLGALLVGRRR